MLLWNSSNWANGQDEVLGVGNEGHPFGWKSKKDDKTIFSHAGQDRSTTIHGDGTVSLKGARTRYYILQPHEGKVRLELKAKAGPSLGNLSLKLFSRHNEDGDCENRFGGVGMDFNFGENTVGSKFESCHNNHEPIDEKDLQKQLQFEKWYGFRYECEKDGKKFKLDGFIDYDLNNDWKQVGHFEGTSVDGADKTQSLLLD